VAVGLSIFPSYHTIGNLEGKLHCEVFSWAAGQQQASGMP